MQVTGDLNNERFPVVLRVEIKLEGVGRDRNVEYLSSPELQEDGSPHKTGLLPSD